MSQGEKERKASKNMKMKNHCPNLKLLRSKTDHGDHFRKVSVYCVCWLFWWMVNYLYKTSILRYYPVVTKSLETCTFYYYTEKYFKDIFSLHFCARGSCNL